MSAELSPQAAEALRKSPRIERVERVEVVYITLVGKPPAKGKPQPEQVTPWGITHIEADKAWALSMGGGTVIAILDTGVDRITQT